MKTFPTLYQKTNTGAIQQWEIAAGDGLVPGTGVIVTFFGQVDGKIQKTMDTIREGKNAGKKNATTAVEQAVKEAEARWKKQKKKGYVESIEAAQADEVDSTVILGGVEPMLAPNKSYPKDDELQKRIVFPCYAQPKLDGMRCIAVVENGKATMWSRTRKPIPTVPHIVADLESRFPTGKVVLDGELYCHEYRDRFEDLISILRQDAPDTEGLHRLVEYHVYDCIEAVSTVGGVVISPETPFKARSSAVKELLYANGGAHDYTVVVETVRCGSLEELHSFYDTCISSEYEGAMARNGHAPYQSGKRSVHLQKMKPFEDHEFMITGVNEGRGKDAGTAATFDIVMPCVCGGHPPVGTPGAHAKARLKAPYARRRELLEHPELWQNKKLTVTLKRLTADGVPYLPVAKAIRDYE